MLNFSTFEIYRLGAPDDESGESGATNYKREFRDTGNIITGYVEMAQPEFAAMVDGVYGKTYRLFSDDTAADLAIGDRLVKDSDLFEVKGVNVNTDGPGRKLEAIIIKLITQ